MVSGARPATGAAPTRVLVAESDEQTRRLVEAVLVAAKHFELAGCARDGLEAVRLFADLRPDVVLVDVAMPRCDGIEATRRMLALRPDARIVAMIPTHQLHVFGQCLDAGATGALRRDARSVAVVPLMLALATRAPRTQDSGSGCALGARNAPPAG